MAPYRIAISCMNEDIYIGEFEYHSMNCNKEKNLKILKWTSLGTFRIKFSTLNAFVYTKTCSGAYEIHAYTMM